MFILGNLLIALAKISDILLTIFYWLVLIRAVISWVSPDPFNPIVRFLDSVTEPILQPLRRLVPRFGIFDISPLIVVLILFFLRIFLVKTLFDLASRLQ